MTSGLSALDGAARVRVHPACNALYYSFYFEGLRRRCPRWRLRFATEGFPADLGHHCLALIVEAPGEPPRRLYVSAGDGPGIHAAGLQWCDVYAKVNLDPSQVPAAGAAKVLALGPSFPVRVWAPARAAALAAWTWLRGAARGARSWREHVANYWRQWRYRLPESAYGPRPGEPGYVFFAATLWRKHTRVNELRANFVRACREVEGLRFEGGFAPRRQGTVPGFEDCLAPRRYPFREYLEATGRSALVFNTPAVADCHGWKLGEFLAQGKAILSTPIVRALPAPLAHSVHLHRVSGERDELVRELRQVLADDAYRRGLEARAVGYYRDYLSPERAIERIWRRAAGPGSATGGEE